MLMATEVHVGAITGLLYYTDVQMFMLDTYRTILSCATNRIHPLMFLSIFSWSGQSNKKKNTFFFFFFFFFNLQLKIWP